MAQHRERVAGSIKFRELNLQFTRDSLLRTELGARPKVQESIGRVPVAL